MSSEGSESMFIFCGILLQIDSECCGRLSDY